jgi:hypothetical protein
MLKTRTPAEQLAEVKRAIAAGDVEVGRLEEEIARRALPVLQGDPEAARISADLEQQKADRSRDLVRLRQAETQLQQTIAAERDAQRRSEALRVPKQLAQGCAAALKLDDEIEDLLQRLATQLARRAEIGDHLVRLSGSAALKRQGDALPVRYKAAASRLLKIAEDGPAAATNNWLALSAAEFIGEAAHRSLRDWDEMSFDDLVPFFGSEAEAKAAQRRLEARGTKTVLDELGDTWTLVRHDELFIDRASAEQVIRSRERTGGTWTVVPHGRGFRVMPAPMAESAAALSQAAG